MAFTSPHGLSELIGLTYRWRAKETDGTQAMKIVHCGPKVQFYLDLVDVSLIFIHEASHLFAKPLFARRALNKANEHRMLELNKSSVNLYGQALFITDRKLELSH